MFNDVVQDEIANTDEYGDGDYICKCLEDFIRVFKKPVDGCPGNNKDRRPRHDEPKGDFARRAAKQSTDGLRLWRWAHRSCRPPYPGDRETSRWLHAPPDVNFQSLAEGDGSESPLKDRHGIGPCNGVDDPRESEAALRQTALT
jgi:hypothetical protein